MANINPALNDEYKELALTAELNADQQAKLVDIQAAKTKALSDFDSKHASRKAKIDGALNSDNKNTRSQAERAQKALDVSRLKEAGKFDAQAMKMLSPEQRDAWNGQKLWAAIAPAFEKEGLSADQETKAVDVCRQVAKGYASSADISQNSGKKKQAAKRVYDEVLTRQQQKDYAERILSERRAAAEAAAAARKAEREKEKDDQAEREARNAKKKAYLDSH